MDDETTHARIGEVARALAERLASPEGREAMRLAQERTRLRTEESRRAASRPIDPFKRVTPIGR